ncbi:Solanesyl diphosphate synthase 3, chloroplastic/mitochondrial [Seminavis robusta]|uniref:Solanesyl diphosphate synthase 3, chloroplastic/mitochondrial n=1 Tax=Seminavis robusta TaxID=568900 RepID=A0A9N8EGZ5_9STRA|nr:Solanesyl diphosphate synthase 3, chloroplastic/mitochondrial [Seminavis robusta]|eukprot:Sro1177_g249430.1 Solanesyl diphosphate synthase 3, chloroplastic/mitochondrial (500) ;mRNA; r:24589-26088
MSQRLIPTRRALLARLYKDSRVSSRTSAQIPTERRFKGSVPFVDFAFSTESVKNAVKSSFLDQASQKDSRLWQAENEIQQQNHSHVNGHGAGVNDPVSTQQDALDEWGLDLTTTYWPELPPSLVHATADPFALAKAELDDLSRSIRDDLLGTDHPVLNKAASYFFESAAGGKKVRPMMVLLLSRALADSATSNSSSTTTTTSSVKSVNGSKEVNGHHHHHGQELEQLFSSPLDWQRSDLPQAQRRLAEISELIHTASLFHDDVIDGSDTRRGLPTVHKVFGNKVAILAGDYLLARASICLARLRHTEVIETMSTIIEHLVRGEIMQLRGTSATERNKERLVYYLRKNYYKTGSLMANSCKSTALLGGYSPEQVWASYRFGKHFGMAFQLVDDILDFEGNVSDLGKPALADLSSGLATAPVLFASEQFPDLEPLIERKFRNEGDVELALDLVHQSNGIERTKELARVHSELAVEALLELGDGVHRDALINLTHKVVSRTK